MAIAFGGTLSVTGCADNSPTVPSPRAPSATLGLITASPMNAILAVGDSFAVSVAGHAVDGSPLTGFDSVRYVLNSIVDTLRVRVSPTGMITGRASSESNPVFLNVFAYKDGVGAFDQVVIQVTPTALSGVTLSIQPVPPDTARLTIGKTKQILPIISDGAGHSVANPQLRLFTNADDAKRVSCYGSYFPNSSAPLTVTSAQLQLQMNGCTSASYPNYIQAMAPGTAWIHAKALVYGTMLEDSVLYMLTNVTQTFIGVQNHNLNVTCFACNVTVAPGGRVYFYNALSSGLGMGMAVTFDDPSAALADNPPATIGGSAGNVTAVLPGQYSTRIFSTPGTYGFTLVLSNAPPPFTNGTYRGQLVVQ